MTLKKQRRMCGLSQKALAERSGILYSRITFAETGRRMLTKEELRRYREVLRERLREISRKVVAV
ncbi:MAG TPA: helix-turn-helix transcriptional regulator [Candidatus Acidoferrales bacterium]|nr:helix-turn-helix transcriptional regulator [Candidatus Acidoferrales bacterium]